MLQETVPHTCVYTPHPSRVEFKVWRTVTLVGAVDVHTQPVHTVDGVQALVHICTVASGAVQLIAVVTDTAEHAGDVLTCAKHTDILEAALVNILAGAAVRSRGEAHLTLTAVTPQGVETLAVLTQIHVLCTLILV